MDGEPRRAPLTESPLRRHLVFVLLLVAYVYSFPYFEQLNNPNENARVWMTRAIVEHHVLNIDRMSAEWGYVNDKATSGAHVYSGKAPGASFLGVPVLYVQTRLWHLLGRPSPSKRDATLWLRIVSVELPICIFLYVFARYIERVSGSAAMRDLLVVALGAGTLIFPYGRLFVGHAQAAALAFSGYILLSGQKDDEEDGERLSRTSRARLAWAGFLTSASVMFEYQAALVAVVLAVYAVARHRRHALIFFAGALPPAVALGVYHTVLFGRPWRFPFGNVENPEYLRQAHSAGFHGLAWPKPPAIVSSLFAPDYGLFFFSPILALGAGCAAVLAARRGPRRREGILALAVAVVMLLFLSGMSNWRAGWCAGPRYIATVAPFLIAPIAQLWPLVARGSRASALSVAAAGLTVPSVVMNVVSGTIYPHYPPQFDNPIFDLAFPLIRAGYAPYSVGTLLGLRGFWSLIPLGVVVSTALVLATMRMVGDEGRWTARDVGRAAGVAALGASVLLALGLSGRRPNASEAAATQIVQRLWEPAVGPRANRSSPGSPDRELSRPRQHEDRRP